MDYEKSIPIWNRLYDLHWDYIQTEENSTDLLSKKDVLKECIKEFLTTSLPDRKFYLPQTVEVLKGSVHKLKKFSAYDASIAFDAIAQYANNLLTKPWRKEYKVIKTHSGFYQHKIKSQLVDVDEMFISMGYTKSQNQTLLFNGPICPDQLANVSRDCMIACEECLIMHRMYYGLKDFNINLSWSEVYQFRESYTGDEQMSLYHFQEKKQKEKMLSENYINPVPPIRCNCNVVHAMSHPPQCQPCQYTYPTMANNTCVIHPQIPHYCQPHYDHTSHLPHSRSMDQYTDHTSSSHDLFRHSLDHSIIGDNVDAHPTNMKPFVPVNQIVHTTPSSSNLYNHHLYNRGEYPLTSNSYRPTNANYPSNKVSLRNYDNHFNTSGYTSGRTYDDDLIKFEDSPKNARCGHQDPSFDNHSQYTDQLRKADLQLNRPRQVFSYAGAVKQGQNFDTAQFSIERRIREIDIKNAEPTKSSKEPRDRAERNAKNQSILAEYQEQSSRDSRASDFDSADYAFDEENAKASRNNDGHGSMEEWAYVYNDIKNPQNYSLRNGNDRAHDSREKTASKKILEPKNESTPNTKNSVTKTNKVNKLRVSKIDEYESQKKTLRNGKSYDKSTVLSEWNCEHCTYLNTKLSKICDMCAKSRDFKDKPLSKSTATSV